MWCGVVWCCVVWCGVVLCGVVWCGTEHSELTSQPRHRLVGATCQGVNLTVKPIGDTRRKLLCIITTSLAKWLRCPPRERKVLGSNPACAGIFSGSSHTSDFKIGTPVATLPGAWRYRVSTGTGRPDVSILWLGEVESWICNFYLSVAARKIVWADPSLRYTSLLLGR